MTASRISLLKESYGEVFPGYLALFDRQTKRTYKFDNTQWNELEQRLNELAPKHDVYIGLGTQNVRVNVKRGGADTVAALPGFVADIDYASKKNSKKNYPQDEAEALSILNKFPIKPTFIIRTGGGLQVFWLFEDLFVTDTSPKRAWAKGLWANFQRNVLEHFKRHGCEIDSVGDLSRNFRIPETLNHKYTPPAEVVILHYDPAARRPITDYAEFAPQKTSPRRAAVRSTQADHKLIGRSRLRATIGPMSTPTPSLLVLDPNHVRPAYDAVPRVANLFWLHLWLPATNRAHTRNIVRHGSPCSRSAQHEPVS